jgi:alanine racemase
MNIAAERAAHRMSQQIEGAQAIIDPAAVAHNVQCLLDLLSANRIQDRPSLWAVAKADAYGHGIGHVIAGFEKADGIAVFSVAEARRVRSLGWEKPILVIGAQTLFASGALDDPALHPLHITVDSESQIRRLEGGRGTSKPFVWLRHTGALHHAGLAGEHYAAAWERLAALAQNGIIQGVGAMQHYARAENAGYLKEERKAFKQATSPFHGPRCTENSAALLLDSSHAGPDDWVRSGIALYGISPLHGTTAANLGLRPAMSLQAPVTAIQHLPQGAPLGYGATFRAAHDMRIGLVACGYACGYPRNLAENCPVMVNGRPSRVVGRVSMDSLTIDLTDHPEAGPGTVVTLWGAPGPSIETVARYAGTIPAQLCSGLTAQVTRR